MSLIEGVVKERMGLWLLALAMIVSVAMYGRAQLTSPGFEGDNSKAWVGPWGGGALGGSAEGVIVNNAASEFVRTGQHALRLTVWDDGNPSAVAWAGVSQTHPCSPGQKIRAGAWLYSSSTRNPPTEGLALAQLRMEYFRDDFVEQEIPTHVTLSTPFSSSSGYAPDNWHLIQMYDRVPPEARTVKMSIMLLSQLPNNQPKEVWVDDAFVEFQGRPRMDRLLFDGVLN